MSKLFGSIVAGIVGLLLSGVAAWGLVSSVTSAPSANPAQQAPVVYGSR